MKRLLICLALAGCAAEQNFRWNGNGTQEDLSRDAGQCQSQAFGVPFATRERVTIVYLSCMQGKGWRLQEAR